MTNIPVIINALFLITVIVTLWIFFRSFLFNKTLISVTLLWIIVQSSLALAGFYTNWEAIPPRLVYMVLPPVLSIIFLAWFKKDFLLTAELKSLTILHSIRIPVEITLFYVFVAGLIPKSMTFEGTNFDILSGLSAPIIFYLAFIKKSVNYKILIGWNILCIILLLNVVITAMLSTKTPFQQLAFDQPNIGIGYFPLALLPSVVVPIVLMCHVTSLRILFSKEFSHNVLQTRNTAA